MNGQVTPGGPCTWEVIDFDQRRCFAVTYDPPTRLKDEEARETDGLCVEKLRKHVDQLGGGVFGIKFSEPDGPITLLTDQQDDPTVWLNNFSLAALSLTFPIKTIFLETLTDLDRFGPNDDLVSYSEAPFVGGGTKPTTTTAAFKYWFIYNGMFRTWYKLNSWSRLPRDHPHIVPFDAVVIDPKTSGIVGFTSRCIPGGTLHDNTATTRPFRLCWFRQLLSVVADLNYQYGIMHQDLLIDEHDNLRIFDFNYATMMKHRLPELDDTKGVIFTLYEIITFRHAFLRGATPGAGCRRCPQDAMGEAPRCQAGRRRSGVQGRFGIVDCGEA